MPRLQVWPPFRGGESVQQLLRSWDRTRFFSFYRGGMLRDIPPESKCARFCVTLVFMRAAVGSLVCSHAAKLFLQLCMRVWAVRMCFRLVLAAEQTCAMCGFGSTFVNCSVISLRFAEGNWDPEELGLILILMSFTTFRRGVSVL